MFPFEKDRMGTPGMTHLNLYLTAKLYWNPRLDVKATLEEYYRLFYGSAASEMRTFWETAAASTETAIAAQAEAAPDALFPRKSLLAMAACLDKAKDLVNKDSVFARRIAVVDAEFRKGAGRLTRMQSAGSSRMQAKPVTRPADVAALKPMRFYGADADLGEPPTWVYCGYDRRNVYLKFLCYEPEMDKVRAKCVKHDDVNLWQDDCLELFFCPNPDDLGHGCQFVVNVAGVLMDCRLIGKDVMEVGWESGASAKVSRETNRWVADVTVPLAALGVDDVNFAGDMLLNLYRTRNAAKAGETFVWSPTDAARHFTPTKFGRLVFDKEQDESVSRH